MINMSSIFAENMQALMVIMKSLLESLKKTDDCPQFVLVNSNFVSNYDLVNI